MKLRKLIIAVLAVVMAVFSCAACSASSSAENVAVKCLKACVEDDISSYYECLSPAYIDYMVGSDGWFSDDDEFKSELEDYNNDDYHSVFVKSLGENFTAEYKATNTTMLEGDDFEDVARILARDYDYDEDEIQALAIVEVTVMASGSNGEKESVYDRSCVKMNGSWYIHRPGF